MNDADLSDLANRGFVRIPDAVPPDTLARLRDFVDSLLVADTVPGKVVSKSSGKAVVTNVDDLFGWGDPRPLELLALPGIMEIASAVCGPDLFPLQEFAVVKHRGDQTPVLWHQDLVSRRSAPSISIGIYLDDADPGDGALRFIPGSHRGHTPIAELVKMPAVEVPAKAGDIIAHDMMIAHSSELMTSNTLRRVIYLVFLSTELALEEALYPAEVIEARRRLLFAGRRFRREIAPGGACWKPRQRDPAPRDRKRPYHEIVSDVYAVPRRLIPSTYHFEHLPANLA